MATTNVQVFNPGAVNQQTDPQYTSDSNRSGGFGADAIWPSPLANKTLNQLSTYIFGLFSAFAAKGFSTSDADASVLAAVCANFLTTADIIPGIVVVAYSPTPAFNAAASNGFQMTLVGNVTDSTISGITPGQLLAFYFVQDATGGRTVSWPSSFTGTVQPDPAPNAASLILFRADLAGVPRAAGPLVSNNGTFSAGLLKATSFTLAAPGTTGQILTNVGGVFVPRGTITTTDSSGSYRICPDGTIECWGTVTLPANNGPLSATVIVFPVAFTAAPVLLVSVAGRPRAGVGDTAMVQTYSLTVNGASVDGQCSPPVGGGGATFDQPVPVSYYAIGH